MSAFLLLLLLLLSAREDRFTRTLTVCFAVRRILTALSSLLNTRSTVPICLAASPRRRPLRIVDKIAVAIAITIEQHDPDREQA